MFTKEMKASINQRLKDNRISKKNDVFRMINQGSTVEEVEAFIDALILEQENQRKPLIVLNPSPAEYNIFGESIISQNAIDDMSAVMSLPYVTGGALMPDAHRVQENHVPVGGVVVSDMIIPEFVSADAACSVLLTITSLPVNDEWFSDRISTLKYVLKNYSYFGQEINPVPAVFEQKFFKNELELETTLGKRIYEECKKIARNQFGTSGDGNHFLEFGSVNLQGRNFHNTGKQRYLAVMSHFGSRNIGAVIANTYTALAMEQYEMPKGMTAAPLDPNSPDGRDYWKLLQWAGDFAEFGHRWLHKQILNELDARKPLSYREENTIYTRHNFCWLTEYGYVHRKGATPAEYGQVSVIPATMGDETQIVIGLGNSESFNSTSHGAGRRFSRGQALQNFGKDNTAEYLLKNHGVYLIGGGADEDPRAYKKIEEVMKYQTECAAILGTFIPKVVRMADPRFEWKRK